jgi:hypothetical protein
MPIGTLTVSDSETISITGQNTLTGSDYSPLTSGQSISAKYSFGTAAANGAIGGADEAASFLTTIGASSSVTLDVGVLVDVMQTAGVALVRVKEIVVRLLSAVQDAVNGTVASAITIDGTVASALLSVAGSGWLTNATSKFDIDNGGKLSWCCGKAGGVLVSGAGKVKLTNLDAGLSAKAQTTFVGGTT